MTASKPTCLEIPIEKLVRGKFQPRRVFDQEALEELAGSIRAAGLIQPIVVRPTDNDHYEIVAGERRWRAAQLAGLDSVPCLFNQYTDEQTAAVTTIENVNRVDLNAIEEAQAYQRLVKDFGYLHEEVAAIIGKSRTKITNTLRLLRLDERVQQLIIDNKISGGHGKIMASLPPASQYALAIKCINKKWSVRKIEQEVKKLQTQDDAIQSETNPDITRLERVISEQFGSQVKLETDTDMRDSTSQKGWLKIRFFDNETLEGLLDKMGIKYD